MIEVRGLEKSFDDNNVLKGVDVVFKKGKTNLIIGRSGSGKTVFLKCLLGLHLADKGSILYDGRDSRLMERKEQGKLRQELGMVFQGGALFDSLTVRENVLFPLQMFADLSQSEIMDRAEFCLSRVKLGDAGERYPAEISGGMKKRVSIARAIVLNPKYLFCDEPNSGLDPMTAVIIDNLLKEITEEFDITTVINTHDMNSVMEIGDHIVLLKDGRKVWEGNRFEILQTEDPNITDFVFTSELFKTIKGVAKAGRK